MCRLLIFELVAPWRGCGCIECSSSAFRKLGTLSRRDDLTKPLFTASLLPSGSFNKWKKKKKKKEKNILGPRVVAVCSTGYSRPLEVNFEIQCVRRECRESHVAHKFRDLLASRVFFSLFSFILFVTDAISCESCLRYLFLCRVNAWKGCLQNVVRIFNVNLIFHWYNLILTRFSSDFYASFLRYFYN